MKLAICGYIIGSLIALSGALFLNPWIFLGGIAIDCFIFLSKSANSS